MAEEAAAQGPVTLLLAARRDPLHLPEYLALLAVAQEGPKAAEAVRQLRAGEKDGEKAEVEGGGDGSAVGGGAGEGRGKGGGLQDVVLARGTRLTVLEGSAVGGPFIMFVPVAFCAAMLAQARMVLELAALAGADPTERERAAELMVLQGVYETVEEAGEALERVAAQEEKEKEEWTGGAGPVAEAEEGQVAGAGEGRSGGTVGMVRRMAYLLGLIGAEEDTRGWLRRAAGWVYVVVLVMVGVVLPLVWIPAMGYSMHKATSMLGRRAVRYYGGGAEEIAEEDSQESGWRPTAALLAGRTLVATALPVMTLLFVVAADIRLADNRWLAGLLALAAAAAVLTGVQAVRHRRRYR